MLPPHCNHHFPCFQTILEKVGRLKGWKIKMLEILHISTNEDGMGWDAIYLSMSISRI